MVGSKRPVCGRGVRYCPCLLFKNYLAGLVQASPFVMQNAFASVIYL